jgi:hypothetical protein
MRRSLSRRVAQLEREDAEAGWRWLVSSSNCYKIVRGVLKPIKHSIHDLLRREPAVREVGLEFPVPTQTGGSQAVPIRAMSRHSGL